MDRFLELIRIALGTQKEFTAPPSDDEWERLYVLANRHAIGGLLFRALTTLPTKGEGGNTHYTHLPQVRLPLRHTQGTVTLTILPAS